MSLTPSGGSSTMDRDSLRCEPVAEPVAGPARRVSSGIDMALRLMELLFDRVAAEASQLMIEYDPQPPFDAGAVDKAGPGVIERVIEFAAHRQ